MKLNIEKVVDGVMGRDVREFVDGFGLNPNEMDIAQNDSADKYASASSRTSPRSATELRIHTAGACFNNATLRTLKSTQSGLITPPVTVSAKLIILNALQYP